MFGENMKLYLKSSEVRSNELVYYHYDNRHFNVESQIVGNDYSNLINPKIKSVYSKILPEISDICSAVYMLDHESEEYEDSYKYGYQVAPIGEVIECFMDYSIVMCQDKFDHIDFDSMDDDLCVDILSRLYDIVVMNHLLLDSDIHTSIRYAFILLYAACYRKDTYDDRRYQLKKYFDIDVSDKVEYICNAAEVLSISENQEI